MLKRIFIIVFIVAISCKPKEFAKENIAIPSYYSNFDYRKFWETKGFNFTFANYIPTNDEYKDSTSTNFFHLHFGFANIMGLPRKERIEILNKEMQLKAFKITDKYEIFKKEYIDTLPTIKGLYNYSFKFISLKDSVEVTIDYQTFDRDKKKLNDYRAIVNEIIRQLKAGSHFKTTEKKLERKSYIVN